MPRQLMMDLGGGSCEVTISNHGHIRETVSLPLGAVRLTNDFFITIRCASRSCSICGVLPRAKSDVSQTASRARPKSGDGDLRHCGFLGYRLSWPVQDEGSRATTVSRAQLRRIAMMLARLPLGERKKLSGVGPRRAEIVVAGAIVYAELVERCQFPGFRYSPLGLRDGLLAQMAAEYDRSTRSGKQMDSERWDSIRAAIAHYRVDMDHAMQVRESAMQLFAALRLCIGCRRNTGVAFRGGDALRSRRLRES